jgi:hypothetical protein
MNAHAAVFANEFVGTVAWQKVYLMKNQRDMSRKIFMMRTYNDFYMKFAQIAV